MDFIDIKKKLRETEITHEALLEEKDWLRRQLSNKKSKLKLADYKQRMIDAASHIAANKIEQTLLTQKLEDLFKIKYVGVIKKTNGEAVYTLKCETQSAANIQRNRLLKQMSRLDPEVKTAIEDGKMVGPVSTNRRFL